MRAQSVSEGFFKFLALMLQCLSQRDNSYCIFAAFGENHNHNPIAKKTIVALLSRWWFEVQDQSRAD